MIFIYEKQSCTVIWETIWVRDKLVNANILETKELKINISERIRFIKLQTTVGILSNSNLIIFQYRLYLIISKDGRNVWDKVFESGPSKICRRQPLKNLNQYGLLKQTISLQFFKGCLPPILPGLLLSTPSHLSIQLPCYRK